MEFRLFSGTILKEAAMAHCRMRTFIVLVCMFGVAASAFAAPGDCDRACLKTALDQYLNEGNWPLPAALVPSPATPARR